MSSSLSTQPSHVTATPIPGEPEGAVFVMTNAASSNEVLAYRRDSDGQLHALGRYDTGGFGSGRPHLSSQGSLVLSHDGAFLLVANPGSQEISVFKISGEEVQLVAASPSGGTGLSSLAVVGDLVYALHKGDADVGDVAGFRLGVDGRLVSINGSRRALSAPGSNPAQVAISPDGRTLVVTEEATNMIDSWTLDAVGRPGSGTFSDSARKTPFGFAFAGNDALVVANAEEGAHGEASVSSYRLDSNGVTVISGAVLDRRSEVCWTVLSPDGALAFVTNFGDGTVSSFSVGADGMVALLESVAGVTTPDQPSIRDAALTRDGRFLYAIDVASGTIHGWEVSETGTLAPVGAWDGLPATAAGLAAR